MATAILERGASIRSIAVGAPRAEGLWVTTLHDALFDVHAELMHMGDLVTVRDGITGTENQRLVAGVMKNALSGMSRTAAISKEFLLKSRSSTENRAVSSEIERAIPTLESVVGLGDTCGSDGDAK